MFTFEMNMGRATIAELHHEFEGRDATILDVGNPQCAVFVDDFDFDWRGLGAPHRAASAVSAIAPTCRLSAWRTGTRWTSGSGSAARVRQ